MLRVVLFLVAALLTNAAFGCSCDRGNLEPIDALAELLKKVDAVTLATAIEVKSDLSVRNLPTFGTKLTRFKPTRVWKGNLNPSFQTKIDANCCVCGVKFKEGEPYVLFLYGPNAEGYYTTSSCMRSRMKRRQSMENEILILEELAGRSQD